MSKPSPQRPSRWPPMPRWFGWVWAVVVGISALVLNSFASADPTPNNTISAHATQAARAYMVWSGVFLGGFAGHLASRGLGLPQLHDLGPVPFLTFVLACGLVDLFVCNWISSNYPYITFIAVGFPVAFIVWQMNEVAT